MNLPDLFDTTPAIPDDLPPMDALGGYAAAVHVYGDALQPTEVTRLFGVDPTEVETPGVPVRHADGSVIRIPKSGRWTLGVPAAGAAGLNFNEMVEGVLTRLPKDAAVWRAVAGMGSIHVSATLAIDESNSEMWLEPQLLSFLGERGVGVHIEIYRRDPDRDESRYY
jgi:hypothetical protein